MAGIAGSTSSPMSVASRSRWAQKHLDFAVRKKLLNWVLVLTIQARDEVYKCVMIASGMNSNHRYA
jgi:hypothetical protein